jgi:multisubunit Na+/H+ antiporter MnhE subunit
MSIKFPQKTSIIRNWIKLCTEMTFLFEIFLFWIFISGNFHIFIFSLGIFGIALVFFISKKIFNKMNVSSGFQSDLTFKTNPIKALKFLFLTFIEIFQSSVFLIKASLEKEKILDEIHEFDFNFANSNEINEIDFTAFSHAITSTPGSITIKQIEKGKILIHFLYKKNLDDFQKLDKKNFV